MRDGGDLAVHDAGGRAHDLPAKHLADALVPMHTPKSGMRGPSSRTACIEIPESSGRPASAKQAPA